MADTGLIPLFSLIHRGTVCCKKMRLLETKWLMGSTPQWKDPESWGPPKSVYYANSGLMPTGSSSDGTHANRYAVLYADDDNDSVLRTSREYYARVRPGGYGAKGTEVNLSIDSTLGFTALLHDVWIADATRSQAVGMVGYAIPDSLSDLVSLLGTEMFATGDSVDIGAVVELNYFAADSAGSAGHYVDCITEVIDSATGNAVAVLDSTRLDAASSSRSARIETTLDLLSGTYQVRTRLVSSDLEENRALEESRGWDVIRIDEWIAQLAPKRVHRLDGEAGNGLRLSAQPNPFSEETEIRFSIPRDSIVTLRVFDATGRVVVELLEGESFDAGRYAAVLRSANLSNGPYIVELRMGEERITTQVVIQR